MKKINILLIAAAVFTSSLHNTFATEYLNHSEKQAVTKVGNKIITTINNQGGCNTELYNSVSVKLVTLHDGFISDSYGKKAEIISVIQTMLYDQWGTCSSTVDEENIDDLISEVVTTKKKGTFKKYIGADIEARQNSSYTYFYYGDILINTVKNEFNNDAGLMYGYDNYGNIDYESDYTFNELKLELYSASYLPQSVHLIHFQKESDSTTSNFFYNTQTNDWSEIVQGFIPTIQKLGGAYIYVHQNHIMSQVYYFDRTSSYLLHSTIDYVSGVEIDMNNHEFDIKIQPRWTDGSINHDIQMQYVEVTDIPDGIGGFAY